MDTAIKFLVIATTVATLVFAIIREGINYLEYPSLQILRYPENGHELILYHRGIADRQATLFFRELDPRATPQRIAALNYDDDATSDARPSATREPLLGTLCWASDRSALVAVARASRLQPDPALLWIFDVGSRTIYAPGQIHGGQRIDQEHLKALLKIKGHLGVPIARWYELGRKENYIFSWKAHHWNNLAGPTSASQVTAALPRKSGNTFTPAGTTEAALP